MEYQIRNNKPTVLILTCAVLITVLVLLLFIPLTKEKEKSNKKYFPNYENIIINERVVNDKNKYNKVITQLQNDETFNKLLLVNDYDSKNASKKDLENMITNYILLYSKSNTITMREINNNDGVFCILEKNLLTSFKDLFNTDIKDYKESLVYYFEHIYKKQNEYCIYYEGVVKKYGKEIISKIDSLSYKDGVITIDAYVYSFSPENQINKESKKNEIKKALENNNYSSAFNITINDLNGTYNKKRIDFKIDNGGKYFKYQLIDIKTLE